MRVIDRLFRYMEHKHLTNYAVEHSCRLSNGYLAKQKKSKKGAVGSDILQKIHTTYLDLSLLWLISGYGEMLLDTTGKELEEGEVPYFTTKDEVIQLLKDKIVVLEASIADKDKIISLLETALEKAKRKKPSGR